MHVSVRKLISQTIRYRRLLTILVTMASVAGAADGLFALEKSPQPKLTKKSIELGKQLFAREWIPNDPRSHGGDGLGPVFNDTSCIACHNQGGPGGGGPMTKNVDIVSAASPFNRVPRRSDPSLAGKFVRSVFGLGNNASSTFDPKNMERLRKQQREHLAIVHPGFRMANSVVLHRFGTDPNYAQWRLKLSGVSNNSRNALFVPEQAMVAAEEQGSSKSGKVLRDFQKIQQGLQKISSTKAELGNAVFTRRSFHNSVTVSATQRNPIALFGAGLIDSVPDSAIEEAAKTKHKQFPEIKGRVCRLKDGRIGRFGWKAQKATLYDFSMTACAVELGLHVPDHAQAGVPLKTDYKPTGLDMNQEECDALVAYLKVLPAPALYKPTHAKEAHYLKEGRELFTSVGCAACHTPKLGDVENLYSDLLLHDIGADLVDTGEYGAFQPSDSGEEDLEEIEATLAQAGTSEGNVTQKLVVGAKQAEWRTPPLWGCRDSAPYLHDGRAQTLKQAIAFHGGEGKDTTIRFFSLSQKQQLQVLAFMKTLTAPEPGQFVNPGNGRLLSRNR